MPTPSSRTAKKPRRTPERILDTSLLLFNRLGEPNVSTTAIAGEMGISPGNLYYHFPAKDGLVDALFDRFAEALQPLLDAADGVENIEDAWLFFHVLFELIWQYRFLYRDLNDLLSKNRRLETHFQQVLGHKAHAVNAVLEGLARGGALHATADETAPVARAMVVVLTYWLSYEYVLDPRHALEPDAAGTALLRGAFHLLSLVAPYLAPDERGHLRALADRYHAPEATAKEAEHVPLDTVPVRRRLPV